MPQKNLTDFLARYNSDGAHPVTEIELPDRYTGQNDSPFIIVRSGPRTMIINPIADSTSLYVDVHSFIDGEAATAGAFGMTEGKRVELPDTGTTSYGFASAPLIAVIVGEQAEV
jgi:hypothetical protein